MKIIRAAGLLIFASLGFLVQGVCVYAAKVQDSVSSADVSIQQILDQKLSAAPVQEANLQIPSDTISALPTVLKLGDDRSDEVEQKKFDVNFDSVDLVDVVNRFAADRGVNIILPTGANEIKSKLTLRMDKRVTIEQAENLLYTVLDVAGYSLIKRLDGFIINKNDKNIPREPLPIFIGVAPDDLPNTDERIRYIYYFANIQVPNIGTERQSELNSIFSQVLPKGSVYKYMPSSNGVLLVDKVSNIKAVMNIVLELDKVGFRENIELLRLRHSSAAIVADIFNKNILAAARQQTSRRRLGWRGKSQGEYFSGTMKIIPEPRTNSLVLLGRQQTIDRVKEFIFKYIDVKLESGKSILHTYKLQYLDAAPFAKTLERIVSSASTGGTGQSRAAGTAKGPEKFFEGVIIRTDTPSPTEKGGEQRYFGGNQLVIAARNEDWHRIKKLIEELDRPQPQVIIEVLIADLEIRDERFLGAHTRTPNALNLPKIINGQMQFQTAQSEPAIASVKGLEGQTATNLEVDLLNKDGYFTSNGTNIRPLPVVPAGGSLTGGSNVMSLNDKNGNTWSILQILQRYDNSKILSHPHVVATNNQQALVEIGETRLLRGEATVGQGGSAISKRQEKTANLTVKITPRISGGNTVNMQVSVDFKEFVGDTADRIDRKVVTNANVDSGSILALGGLIKIDTAHGLNETPVLGRIPIVGWFFKRRAGKTQKNNLTVFIRPTIVIPRLRGGIDRYTRDYIKVAKEYVEEGMLFDTLRDPITRWFFRTGIDAKDAIDAFALESPQGRPAQIGAKVGSLVSNDEEISVPMFKKNRSRTVLAAAEGRDSRNHESRGADVLGLKNDLMDFDTDLASVTEKTVLAQNGPPPTPKKKRRRRSRKRRTQKITVARDSVVDKQKGPVAVNSQSAVQSTPVPIPVPQNREEKLKAMISDQDNPLLRS